MDPYYAIYAHRNSAHIHPYVLLIYAMSRQQAIHRTRMILDSNTYILLSINRIEIDLL